MLIRQDVFIICLDTILLLCALGLLIPSMVLFIECVTALFWQSSDVTESVLREHPNLVVLVPAHDEASCIRGTLETVIPQIKGLDRLVVVADNCSDDTAAIAQAIGATVIERHDPDLRGKGYALDYGLQFLAQDPPDVVVVVDADCQVYPGAVEQLAKQAIATHRPVQAVYLMEIPNHPSPKDSISAFAVKVKNLVRPLGLTQLGLPCPLAGTGMAFPWSVIRSVDLASGNIVEDMKLGLDLAIVGYSPMFCPNANVLGGLPQQQQAAASQRTRWEHGHMQTLLNYFPVLLKASIQQKRFDLLMMALDLAVPPLSLLVILWFVLVISAFLAGILGASWIPSIVLTISGFFLLTSILVAWARFGRSDLPLIELLGIPLYLLWKIPLYLKFLMRPQRSWIRTERDAVSSFQNFGDITGPKSRL